MPVTDEHPHGRIFVPDRPGGLRGLHLETVLAKDRVIRQAHAAGLRPAARWVGETDDFLPWVGPPDLRPQHPGVSVDQDDLLEDDQLFALQLTDAGAHRVAVEIAAHQQLFVRVVPGSSHVLGSAEVGVNRTQQRLNRSLEFLAVKRGIHRGLGFVDEFRADPTAVGALEAPPLPAGGGFGPFPKFGREVAATRWSAAEQHAAVGGAEHGKQAGLPHRLQVGDVSELIHQQQMGLLATEAVGEVGAGQGDLAAVAEFHGEGGFHGPVDPARRDHLLQVGPSNVLGHLSAGGQVEDLAAGLL